MKKKKPEPTSSLCSESVSIEDIVVEVVDVAAAAAAVLFAFGIRPNNEVALSALAYPTTPVMARDTQKTSSRTNRIF